MNRFFNKSAIALAVLSLAGTSYAGFLPGTINGFFAGAEGLDLQPRNEDMEFVTVFPNTPTGFISNVAINPSYKWDWRVYAGIRFCGNEDITASWLRFHTRDNRAIGTPNSLVPGVPGITQPRWLFDGTWTNINSHVATDVDDVHAEFGHTINFQAWSVRLAGGVEWAKINSDMTVAATTFPIAPPVPPLAGFKSESHTRGVGPRIEADMAYHLPYNFKVFSDANAALLVSYRNISLNTLNILTSTPSTFSNRHIVVPKFGMRLGVAYGYVFGNVGAEGAAPCQTTAVSVAAGWQAETYIHSIERPDFSNNIFTQSTNLLTKVSNYSYQGLFLGVRVATDWI